MSRPQGRGRGGSDRGGARGGGGDRGRGGGGRGGRGGSAMPVEVFRAPSGQIPQPSPHVTNAEDAFMKASLGLGALDSLSLSATAKTPIRPGYGTQGTPIIVWANYYEVSTAQGISYYRYHVQIEPVGKAPKVSKARTKRLFELLLEKEPFTGGSTDFKASLVTQTQILDSPLQIVLPWRASGEDAPAEVPNEYRYTVQETGQIPVTMLLDYLRSSTANAPVFAQKEEIIQSLNAVMGHYAQANPNTVTLSQNRHYSINKALMEQSRVLGGGLEALRGVFKSVRTGTTRLLLNVNVSHAVCYEHTSLDRLMRRFGTANYIRLVKYLKKLRVIRTHLPPRFNKAKQVITAPKSIYDLANTNDGFDSVHPPSVPKYGAGPKDVKFFLEQDGKAGKYISVYDYFNKNYPKVRLDANLPLVNVGNAQNPSYLPAEVCEVLPGQPIGRKLMPEETRAMIEFACRKPIHNANFITREARQVLGLDNPGSNLKRFGLQVGPALLTVPARVLAPPRINYLAVGNTNKAVPKSINPQFGSWNMEGIRFNVGKEVTDWTFVWVTSNRGGDSGFYDMEHLGATVKKFASFMYRTGIPVGPMISQVPPALLKLEDGKEAENDIKIAGLLKAMATSAQFPKPKFVLFVLPYNDAAIYRKIKSVADLRAGIHTVCVVGSKFAKENRQEQYFANVALKFNLKAGGINQCVDPQKLGLISEGKTMVVGIDVTHPQPGAKESAPSVAGIVASVDRFLGQWPADIRIQESRKEMVTDLGGMLKSRLALWRARNKTLPDNILIYRDGVSEGQYRAVLDQELPLLRAACADVYQPAQTARGIPAFTIIIVGKRHHTRFYPTQESDADRSSNCKNGTIVDRGVTEARNWDFFLQAHTCLQGTAKPAHYYIILDEIFRARKPMNPAHKTTADVIEDITHNMCHLFGRATKAVSICPPAYYADLLCERARCYLGRLFEPPTPSDTPAGSAAGSDAGSAPPTNADVQVHAALRDSMFYI